MWGERNIKLVAKSKKKRRRGAQQSWNRYYYVTHSFFSLCVYCCTLYSACRLCVYVPGLFEFLIFIAWSAYLSFYICLFPGKCFPSSRTVIEKMFPYHLTYCIALYFLKTSEKEKKQIRLVFSPLIHFDFWSFPAVIIHVGYKEMIKKKEASLGQEAKSKT